MPLSAWVLAFGALAAAPAAGYAGALFSSMAYAGFEFEAADAGAAVEWTLPWYGEIDVEAADATPDAETLWLSREDNNLSVAVEAETPRSLAYADYRVIDGARVAASATAGVVAGIADAQIDLAAADAWAYGYAGSYFENSFRLIGGTAGDPVQVSFQVGWSREFKVDGSVGVGRWELLNGIFLSLYDPVTAQLLAESTMRVARSGYGQEAFGDPGSDDLLGIGTTLVYGQDYLLYGAADVLVYARTPAPAPGLLLLAGLIAMQLVQTRRWHAT